MPLSGAGNLIGELDLLQETTDGLIEHMEQIKAVQANRREHP